MYIYKALYYSVLALPQHHLVTIVTFTGCSLPPLCLTTAIVAHELFMFFPS